MRYLTENAALPHGSGTDRALGKRDFALIDTGGKFRGYVADVTRVRSQPPPDNRDARLTAPPTRSDVRPRQVGDSRCEHADMVDCPRGATQGA